MNGLTRSNSQTDRLAVLTDVTASVLRSLRVAHTRAYLEEAVLYAHLATNARVESGGDGERPRVNWSDPSNLACVVVEALKRYHVKHEVTDEPAIADDSATLVVLAGSNGSLVPAHRLGLLQQQLGDRLLVRLANGRVQSVRASDVEQFVALHRSRYSVEPGFSDRRARLRLDGAGAMLTAAMAVGLITVALARALRTGAPLSWMPSVVLLGLGVVIAWQLALVDRSGRGAGAIEKLCAGGKGGARNCRAVLWSQFGQVVAGVRWTDLCVVYFAGLFALVVGALFENAYADIAGVLAWSALAPVVVVPLLAYRQFARLKAICILCLATQAVLVLHATVLWVLRPPATFAITLPGALWFAAAVTTAAVVYGNLTRRWTLEAQVRTLRSAQERTAADPAYFDTLARREPVVSDADLPGAIVLGNPEAAVRLTVVLSPFCQPCADKLRELERLEDWFEDGVRVSILLKSDGLATEVTERVTRLALAGEHRQAVSALSDWYAQLARHGGGRLRLRPPAALPDGASADSDAVAAATASHERWFASHRIPYTPFFVLDARPLPQEYASTDRLIDVLEYRQELVAV